jgi:hypothetical protein
MTQKYEWKVLTGGEVRDLNSLLTDLDNQGFEIFSIMQNPLTVVARKDFAGETRQLTNLERARKINPNATQEEADEDFPND